MGFSSWTPKLCRSFWEMRDEPRNLGIVETLRIEDARTVASDSERLLLRQFGTARGDFGNWNLAISREYGRKGSTRDLHELHESSEWEVSISRHQYRATLSASHPRTGGRSFKLLDSGQSLRRLRLEQQQRSGGAREASGPPLARDSGGDFKHGRVRSCLLGEGVWRVERWASTRPHSEPRSEKGVHPQTHLHTRACTAQHEARGGHTRVLVTTVTHSTTESLRVPDESATWLRLLKRFCACQEGFVALPAFVVPSAWVCPSVLRLSPGGLCYAATIACATIFLSHVHGRGAIRLSQFARGHGSL